MEQTKIERWKWLISENTLLSLILKVAESFRSTMIQYQETWPGKIIKEHLKNLLKLNPNLFSIAINTPYEFYNVIQNSIDVEKGTEMLIRVKPIQLVSDESIRSVPIEQRKCRFENEVPEDMPLFKIYSRNACLFNCMYQFR